MDVILKHNFKRNGGALLCIKLLAVLNKESGVEGRAVYFCAIILILFSAMCLFFIHIKFNFFSFLLGCNII